jgi:hypothetical protein
MKKFLIVTNVCTLVLLYLTAFNTPKASQQTSSSTSGPSDSLTFCQPCTSPNNIPLNGLIDLPTAFQLADNYKATCTANDTRNIWFSIGTLKRFLYLIERKTCQNSLCIDKSKLGIRIYYGRYPALFSPTNQNYAGISPAYTDKHTLFMVPTYNKNGINTDFNPNSFNTFKNCNNPLPITSTMPTAGVDWLILSPNAIQYTNNSLTGNPSNIIQNHGDLMPPPAVTNLCDLGACVGN